MENTKLEIKLGFERIRRQVAELCSTPSASELVAQMDFSTSAKEVEWRQSVAEEVRLALLTEPQFPKGELVEFSIVVAKLATQGSFLEADELLLLSGGLKGVGEATRMFLSARQRYPLMASESAKVESFPDVVSHIDTLIDRHGEVRDSASAELYEIRRSIRAHEGQAAKRLQAVLAAAIKEGIVEEGASLSIRDGRSVIPVAAANKRKLRGFVHDESATGKTVYIEPVEVVEINNALKELEYAERREIIRLLTEFTESIRPYGGQMAESRRYLTGFDFLRAKARWAVANGAYKPILSDDGTLRLVEARHPLLQQSHAKEKKEVVPLDLRLDGGRRILVISGPNAGGKSVCLKTVGLLQYMFQCGLAIPAGGLSELPIFERIFIDIGDQQSIENDLSTYSSHLTNMKEMLAGAGPSTLILIDEFGGGTEPTIGGAIAEAMLERFVESGTYGIVTTHYTNIKYFASNHRGVANGAMLFDVQNIRPLFRLEMGEPGSSFAIEIARKIGLPEQIIRSASEKVGTEVMSLERQLREVARSRNYWEQKRERIRIADRRVEEMESEYATRLAGLKEERAAIIRQAKEDAREILDQTNRTIENTVRIIRESQAERETTRLARRELESLRERVESDVDYLSAESEKVAREMEKIERRRQKRAERKAQRGEVESTPKAEPEPVVLPIVVGAKVRIVGQEGVGEIVSVKGKKATVAIGQITTTIAIDRLEAISQNEYKKQTRPTTARTVVSVDISSRKLAFKDNIDIRGMRAGEAMEVVQDFIDDAIMVGIGTVTILHGKGTGALKEEVRRYLRYIPQVASATDDHPDRGGAGITVVKFK
ncbi:MAG: Smr/MutS family protein [Tidjanibacter sp.]|nr:Smr/MutS family protein [Tidjanibacter sp.]